MQSTIYHHTNKDDLVWEALVAAFTDWHMVWQWLPWQQHSSSNCGSSNCSSSNCGSSNCGSSNCSSSNCSSSNCTGCICWRRCGRSGGERGILCMGVRALVQAVRGGIFTPNRFTCCSCCTWTMILWIAVTANTIAHALETEKK